jgi:hypothetical protein
MKIPDWCVFCKQPLNKAKKFPKIDYDNSHVMWCNNCPTRLISWGHSLYSSTIHTYEVTFSTKDYKPENIYSIVFHIDNFVIEMYPSNNRPNGDAFRLFKVDYETFYNVQFIFGTSSLPNMDFKNLSVEYVKNKVIKYIPFI